jgi:hypothetical protein
VQQHSTRSKEKKIEHNPMPLGCVVFLAEELLRLFFKNKKNEGIVLKYNNYNNIIQQLFRAKRTAKQIVRPQGR